MNYEKFVKEVKRGVEDIVEKELGEGVVVVRNVLKNNNVRRKAISIVRKEEVATPTIYLRNYFVIKIYGSSNVASIFSISVAM